MQRGDLHDMAMQLEMEAGSQVVRDHFTNSFERRALVLRTSEGNGLTSSAVVA